VNTAVADGSACTDTDGNQCTKAGCRAGTCDQRFSIDAACTVTNCQMTYPFSSSDPRTSVVFNESDVLSVFTPQGGIAAGPGNPGVTIKLWYNDEHALTLGVGQVTVTTKAGTTTTSYDLAPLCATPASGCSAAGPQVGTLVLDGDQAGTDTSTCAGYPDLCDRPMFPALFITDITNDPTSRAGDWQSGGIAIPPSTVFGTWKGAIRTVDKTKTPAVITVTQLADPAKNHWNLGAGSDPVPMHCSTTVGLTCTTNADCPAGQTCVLPDDEGYGAEVLWDVDDLITSGFMAVGRSYRLQFMVHDGDQNKTGGDSGENCVNVALP
jgi:hypothetical protein